MKEQKDKLEDIIKNINNHQKNLSATKKIRESYEIMEPYEVSEQVCDGWSVGVRTEYRTEHRAITIPAEYAPDEDKRQAAKEMLQEIYQSSIWHSARYKTGLVLKIDEEELNKQLNDSIDFLKKAYKHPNMTSESIKQDLRQLYHDATQRHQRTRIASLLDISQYKLLADELARRTNLTESELKVVYLSKDLPEHSRMHAADTLGYNRVKIWKDKHPVIAALTGISLFVK